MLNLSMRILTIYFGEEKLSELIPNSEYDFPTIASEREKGFASIYSEVLNQETVLRNLFGDEIKIVVAEEQTEGTVCSCLLAKEYINKDVPLGITTLDVFYLTLTFER